MAYKDKEKQREYLANHYQSNKNVYDTRVKQGRTKLQQELRDLKESTPCADCGNRFPHYVMQFDHSRGEKLFVIGSSASKYSKTVIMDEVAKCDIVCANCHCERTFKRNQQYLAPLV